MKRIDVAEAALGDLRSILRHSLRQWGLDRSLAYVDDIEARIAGLAAGRTVTRPALGLPPHIRGLRHGRHIVYLIEDADWIRVIRILHDRMDPARHLTDDG